MKPSPSAPQHRAPPAANLPQPPGHLGPSGADLWQRLTADFCFEDAGAVALLTVACECLDRARRAQALVLEHGELVEDRLGGLKANPAVAIERDAHRGMLAALRALHLDVEAPGPIGRPANAGARAARAW